MTRRPDTGHDPEPPAAHRSDWLIGLGLDRAGDRLSLILQATDPHGPPRTGAYAISLSDHRSWFDLFADLAREYGTRPAKAVAPINRPPHSSVRPVLTRNLTDRILYGYGDPAVTRVDAPDGSTRWWLYVTSNDAPDAFPILSSDDLEYWRPEGFVFPEGAAPEWTRTGANHADFWAPEMHRVGEEYWVCFAARERTGALAIGMARASHPAGPFTAGDAPLLSGGVIDPHIVMDPDGEPFLVWKEDANDRWPPLLATLLNHEPRLISRLFDQPRDRRTAELCSRLLVLFPDAAPMEVFFILQPMIDAAADDFPAFRARLSEISDDPALAPDLRQLAREAHEATETAIRARRLTPDGSALTGESAVILRNDQAWEAHLIEGPWITRIKDVYALFYAGNDFSTDRYGLGVAVAEHPLGPYRKAAEPLLRSTSAWTAPGHPSITTDADGRPRMFLHGFHPRDAGYKVFRALLTAQVRLENGEVCIGE
ncbi:hypothetical protein GGQ87_000099 [Brevundimonas alba]|uniref:Uncharacterized protein n=1 Tax=Brevundimonas alba TaxID=74314 RepID=A0A7X5YIJ3_9CAUL|nr:family 43 glycosylhydrolase [Brevundimonas alba]NJC39841.1 hypothetical protein [Brevundimonas alba]